MRYVSSKDSTISFPDNFVKLEPKQSIHGLPVENGFQEVCEFLHLLGTLFLKIFFFQLYLRGSGTALEMVKCGEKMGLGVLILSRFSEEGDNTRDGLELADYCNQMFKWSPKSSYCAPHSWKLLFGAPAPVEMFW